MNSERILVIASTSYKRNAPENIKKLEESRNHYRLRSEGTESCFATQTSRGVMNELQEQEHLPTVQQVAAEVARRRERVQDLEDARELDAAIRRNGDKPLIPWDQATNDLGLCQEPGLRQILNEPPTVAVCEWGAKLSARNPK